MSKGKPNYAVEWYNHSSKIWDAFAWFSVRDEAEDYIQRVWINTQNYRIVELEDEND